MTAIPEILDVVARDIGPAPKAVAPAPVLIPEQHVAFGTAVVLRPPARPSRWNRVTSAVSVAVRGMTLTSTPDARPKRQDCPRRYAFLENASMARAMERL